MDELRTASEKNKSTDGFIFLSAVILFLVPDIIISVYMVTTGCFMKDIVQTIIKGLCVITASIIFCISIAKENSEKEAFVNALANIFLFFTLYNVINSLRALAVKFLLKRTADIFILYSPYPVVFAIEIPLLIYCLFGCVSNCSSLKAFGQLLKAPLKFFIWFILLLIALVIPQINEITSVFFEKRLIFNTMMKAFVFRVATVSIMSLIFILVIKMMINYRDKKEIKSKKNYSYVFVIVAAILAVVSFGGDYVANIESEADKALRNIGYYIDIASDQLSYENLDTSCYYFSTARNHYELYKTWLDGYCEDKYYHNNENDLDALAIYSFCDEAYNTTENQVLQKWPEDLNANMIALYCYTKQNQASEDYSVSDENLYTAGFLAANRIFRNKYPDVTKLTEKQKADFREKLLELDTVNGMVDILDYWTESIITGEMRNENGMLDVADRYPDNLNIQYIVCSYVSKAVTDGIDNARIRCALCVERMIALSEKDDSLSEEMKNFYLNQAYSFYCDLGKYEEALKVIDKIKAADMQQQLILETEKLFIYDRLGKDDELYSYSLSLAEKGSSIPAVYYYAALGSVKKQDYDKALDNYIRLCQLYEENHYRGDELIEWENSVFVLCEYIAVRDSSAWTDFQYNFYEKMTDAQKTRLAENRLAENYLNCVYYTYETNKKDVSLQLADELLKIDDHFSMVHYLKGCKHYENKQFNEAISEFNKAEALNSQSAAIVYGLANAYDGNGQYQLAYEATVRCNDIISHTDHEKDWYGIGIHNNNLMNRLKNKLQEMERGEE